VTFYPQSIASFTTKIDLQTVVDASDVNNLQNEVVAIETALGTNIAVSPTAGSFPSATARIGALETGKSPISHTHVHATLSALGADDHPQYMLASVAEATGEILVGASPGVVTGLPLGEPGDMLTVAPAAPQGVAWLPNTVPVGTVLMWAGAGTTVTTVSQQLNRTYTTTSLLLPYGFLLCDGSAYSITQYSDLYAVIGDLYGTAPEGYFLVPNMAATFPIGTGTGPGFANQQPTTITYGIGDRGGNAGEPLNISQLAAHNHLFTDQGHAHGVSDPAHSHTPKAVNASYGGGFLAKYSPSSYGGSADPDDYMGEAISGEYQSTTASASTQITINSAVTNASVGSTGSGAQHNNIPPYLALNFIIRY